MATVVENLMAAFAGESQANRKYLAYAAQAEKDGYPSVAKLFRAAAEAETIHALSHFRKAGKVNGTLDNLKDAIAGELEESTQMYPAMSSDASAEGAAATAKYFDMVGRVESVHADLYKKALDNPSAEKEYYLCPMCGYIHEGPADKCPVCGLDGAKMKKVD